MPTPVTTARQCLTDEAARALDDAISIARRRSHTQTTSLHAVSALLSLSPVSPLRDACLRARTAAYSSCLQLRALKISVGVSLDRLPMLKSSVDAPPVANSLMAAIKRSQANQRRHPDTWQMYQQLQSPTQSTSSVIKVEIKHFILSILDDPIVSRVLGEAGFRSTDLKLSVLHPPPMSKFPIYHPLFLAKSPDSDSNRCCFSFPFAEFDFLDEHCRKIGEILVKKKGNKRNPLLIGAFANEALINFTGKVKTGEASVIPGELGEVGVVCLEKEGFRVKFQELRGILGNSLGGGVLVSVGDFRGLIGDLVKEMSELMGVYGERLWVMGFVGSYDMYMKILGEFPSMEKDWDLQLLPITSSPSNGGLSSKSSLMGSFVPLGGFFPSPSEFTSQLSFTAQSTRCSICNEKYETEVFATLRGGSSTSNSTDYYAEDDRSILDAKLMILQDKWNDICRRLHHANPLSLKISKNMSQFVGSYHQTSNLGLSLPSNGCPYLITSSPMDLQSAIVSNSTISYPTTSEGSNTKSIVVNYQTSPSLVTSVTTDLGLGTIFAPKEPHNHKFESVVSTKPDGFGKSGSQCVTYPQADVRDFKSIYKLVSEKTGRRNEAIRAICQAISRCKGGLGRPRGTTRGDIWLHFSGQDKIGKNKVAQALSGIIFGSKGTMIAVDLGSENGMRCSNSIFRGQTVNRYRRKTGVDCIVDELSKNPHSVVFLENVHKADYLAQNSLLQAIRTGRFANLHGKEISINNAIFVTTSDTSKIHNESLYTKDFVRFSEERILDAKSWQMQILVRYVNAYTSKTDETSVFIAKKRKVIDINEPKQALKGSKFVLDLNLPVENEEDGEDDIESESSKAWLEEFLKQVDENVAFQPFDFDALSSELLREIDRRFRTIVGSDVMLEIDDDVAVQIIAVAWFLGRMEVENWVEKVLMGSFWEAKGRCKSLDGGVILKLVAYEGVYGEDQPRLPSRITIN